MKNALIFAAFALFIFSRRKARLEKPSGPVTVGTGGGNVTLNHEEGLASVLQDFGPDIARKVERIYRLETNNFTSGGYRNTGAAGQKAVNTNYPFGWSARGTTPDMFNPVWFAKDNLEGGAAVPWVSWKRTSDAMVFLAKVINDRGGNMGAWNSTDPARQAAYNTRAMAFGTPIVDNLLS